MDRATKLIALCSLAAAFIVEILLLRRLWPAVFPATSAAFLGALIASAWLGDVVIAAILPVGYLLPIGFRFLVGHWDATLWVPWTAAIFGAIVLRSVATTWKSFGASPSAGEKMRWTAREYRECCVSISASVSKR